MINTRCPACGNETRVPESIIGKKVRCKDPACQHVFAAVEYVEPVAASAPARDADLFRPSFPEPKWDAPEDEPQPTPVQPKPRKRAREAQGNYPNLLDYLQRARTAALVQLILLLVLAGLIPIISFVAPLYNDRPTSEAVVGFVFGFLAGAVIAVVAYGTYRFTMALIEFVHVIIDIESNTRLTAVVAGERGE